MCKRKLSLILISSLLFALTRAPSARANTKAEKEAALAAKVKAGIAKLGGHHHRADLDRSQQ